MKLGLQTRVASHTNGPSYLLFGLTCLETSNFFAFIPVRITRGHPCKLFVPIQSLALESMSVSSKHGRALTLLKRTLARDVSNHRTYMLFHSHDITVLHSWLVCFLCLGYMLIFSFSRGCCRPTPPFSFLLYYFSIIAFLFLFHCE